MSDRNIAAKAIAPEHSALAWNPRYQERDWVVVDYQEYTLPGVKIPMRGPEVDPSKGTYFSAIGAAQTHGTLAQKAYPTGVAEHFGLDALNFGYPAANPGYFARQQKVIDYINGGRFLILQVMAARAEPNRYHGAEGYCETVKDLETGEILPAIMSWARMYERHPDEIGAIVQDSRESWMADNRLLIEQIKVPIVMLWISHERYFADPIDFQADFASSEAFTPIRMDFPQFVDREIVNPIAALCDDFVACDSRRNRAPLLISRFTGEPVELDNTLIDPRYKDIAPPMTHNGYYPSDEIHADAAELLIAAIDRVAAKHPEMLAKK